MFADLVDSVVQTIDKYPAEHTASPEQPQVHLLTGKSMEVKRGECFTIKLADQEGLHEVKGFEIEDPRLVIRTSYRGDVGEFPCLALKAGKTKIRLQVAHTKSLTVAFQDVMITISDQTQLPPPTHPNEEGSTDWNRQPDKSEMSLKQASKESDNRPPKCPATRVATGSLPPSKKPKKDDDNNDLRRGSGRGKRPVGRKRRN